MNNVGNVSRARGGSSRCDFVGVEPRLASPAPSERRPSQMAGINLSLQALIDDWMHRERPYLDVEFNDLSLMTSNVDIVSHIEILPSADKSPETDVITVLFPWMQVTVICSIEITLSELKNELFERLKGMAVSQFSMEPTDYAFRGMRSATGEMETLFNEECELYKLDLTLPFPMLFLYEPEGSRHEKELSKSIGLALGYSLELLEQDLSDELKSCRASLWGVTNETVEQRGSGGYSHYAFPEEVILDLEEECPQQLLSKISSSKLHYEVFYRTRSCEQTSEDRGCLRVDVAFEEDMTPMHLVRKSLEELRLMGHSPDEDEYLLQLVGQKKYLTRDDRRLVAYNSVRSSLGNYLNPMFVLRRKDIVLQDYPKPRALLKPYYVHAENSKAEMEDREAVPSLWTVDENLTIRPISYSNMGAHHDQNSSIVVTFTFYVGSVVMNTLASKEVNPRNPRWFEPSMYTGIYMKDVPESLVLCIQLFEVKREKGRKAGKKEDDKDTLKRDSETEKDGIDGREKKDFAAGSEKRDDTYKGWPDFFKLLDNEDENGKSKKLKDKQEDKVTVTQLGWANLPLYDWKGELQLGTFTVSLWPGEPLLPPNALLGQNETKTDGRQAAHCRITFDLLTTVTSRESNNRRLCRLVDDSCWAELHAARIRRPQNIPDQPLEDCEDVMRIYDLLRKRYIGGRLEDDDQQFIWSWRHYIAAFVPDALLLVLESKPTWETRETFGEVYTMMYFTGWSRLTISAALTILSCKHTDRLVRKFAVDQLDAALDDHSFPLFILPLIQALKCEMWAFSNLACMLLRRALCDYRIGHKLFWLLRAELIGIRDVDGAGNEMFKRIALIIEAYLRGNDEHLTTVLKQVEMVEFLSNLTSVIKTYREKDSATKKLRDVLREKCTVVENVDSPLDPTNVLGELIIDKCKVLGSAKMPLRLSWKNLNPFSQHHMPTYEIIFKNGDDLRQDMLVLQVLEVMDSTWEKNQLDFCLSPYPVLPTGIKVGMIGVVANCATIFEIQSEGGKMGTAVKSLETTFINKYVRTNAGATKEYLECVDRFLMSCVGYSVSTFIMGIKDRHNDNIMISKDGRLFHIDFGHILGHGKTKLGIQRDRVPFVLTEHFLCVIGKGRPVTKDAHDVSKFRKLCIDAYLMLWDMRLLFLSLFTAMQSMELPELSTDADLDYLKRTLRVFDDDRDRDAAGLFFSEIFDEAFNGSWSTKTNWFFHAVKHL